MSTALFENSKNVCYNDKMYFVIHSYNNNGNISYILRDIETNNIEKDIPEVDIKSCPVENVIEHYWDKFTYTGDDRSASNFILECIIKKCSKLSNIRYGSNADKTQYFFEINGGSNYWTKNKI